MISKNSILKNLEKYLKRSFKGKVRINESSLIAYLLVGGFFCFVSNVGYATVAKKEEIKYLSTGSETTDGLAINFAQALGNSQTIAIGGNDHDNKKGNAIAKGGGSIAVGGNSRTDGATAVAVGWHAEAKGDNSTAYGESTVAAKDSVAIGSKAKAAENSRLGNAVAVGVEAEAKEGATALGAKSKAKGDNAISVGRDSKAFSNESIVVGHNAEATANASQSVTVGYKAKTEGQNGVTIGTETSSIGNNSVVIGKGSKVEKLTPEDQVDGVEDYSKLAFDSAVVIGNDAVAKQQYAIVMGQKATGLGEDSFAFGRNSNARKNRSIAFGKETLTNGENAIAFGERAQAYSVNSVSIASGAKSKGEQALAFGSQSNSNGQDSIAIGTKAMVGKDIKPGDDKGMVNDGTALGGYSKVISKEGTTLGAHSSVSSEGGVALGAKSNADRERVMNASEVYLGSDTNVKGTVKGSLGAVSVGNSTETRQIVNVAAGAQDTDAVNVAQLKAVESMIKNKEDSYSSWEIQGNGTKVNDVKSKNQVDFVSGDGTTAEVQKSSESKTTVKYSVNKSTLTVDPSGKVSTEEKKDGDYFATAKDVAKAINESEKTTTVVSKDEKLLKVTSQQDKTKPLNTEYTISLGDTAKKAIEDVTKNKITVKGGENEANSFVVSDGGSIDVVAEEKDGIVNVGVDSKRKAITVGIDKTKFATEVTNNTTVQNNVNSIKNLQSTTIALAGNSGETDPQSLSKQQVKFTIKGEGIESIAKGETVTLSIKDNAITKQKLSDDVQLNFSGNGGKGAVKVKDGTFEIKGENGIVTDASNSKLVVKIADETKKKIDNAADNNLSNITDSGKTVIHNAIAMENGENTTVSHTIKNGVKTFKVDVKADGKIENGNNKIVTGDTVYKAIEENKTRYYSVNVKDEDKEKEGSNYKNDGATAEYALAAGPYAKATAKNASAFGYHAEATKEDSVALGAYSTTNEEVSEVNEVKGEKLTFGAFAGNKPTSQVSVGSSGKERQIKHVAAGAVTQNSTDAVNGSQLHATNLILEAVADSTKNIIGGPTQLNSNGTIFVPDGKGIANTTKKTVHEAIIQARTTVTGDSMIDAEDEEKNGAHNYKLSLKNNSITEEKLSDAVKNKIEKTFTVSANSGAKDTVKKEENIDFSNTDGNITIGYDAANNKFTHDLSKNLQNIDTIGGNGSKISFVNKTISVNNSRITNVADGTEDTDAVNKGQLDNAIKAGKTKVVKGTNIASVEETIDPTTKAATYKVNAEGAKVTGVGGVEVTESKDNTTNVTTYKVGLADKVTLGKDGKAITLDGTTGKVNVGNVEVNGEKGTIGGLANKTWNPNNIVSGQAATEDQLKVVDEKVEKGLNFAANHGDVYNAKLGATVAVKGNDKVSKEDAESKYDVENVVTTVDKDGNIQIKMAKNAKFTTVTTGNTTISNSGMVIQKGKAEENVSLTDKGLNNGGNKITNVADGTVEKDSKDAVNGGQLHEVKQDAKAAKTEVTSTGKTVQVTKQAATDGHTIYNVEVRQNVKYVTEDGKEVILGTDRNFYHPEDLKEDGTPVDANKAIPKDKVKAKLEEEAKLDNISGGKIADGSKEAINGSQLKEVGDYLGLEPKKDGTGFEKPTFTALKNVDGSDNTAPKNVIDSVNTTIGKVNEGFKYGADMAKDNQTNPRTQQLGSTLFIKSATEDLTKAGNTDTKFVGKNIVTNYENNGGNGTVSIGISEKPEFKEVTLKDGDGNTTTINKDGMTIAAKDPAGGKKEVSLTKDGLNNGGNKITNVADGTISSDSKEAVNGSQLDKVAKESKTEVKSEKKTVQVTESKGKEGQTVYNLEVKQNVVYKDGAGKDVVQGEDGNFYHPEDLNEAGKPKDGKVKPVDSVKAELAKEAKLDKVADGKIADKSKEAINGSQLKEVGDYLGLEPKKDGTGFEKPTFTALKNVDGSDNTAPKNVIDSVNKTVGKINEGLKYGADNTTTPTTQQLGSSLLVKSATEDLTKAGNTDTKFVGKNIVTNYENNGGNGTVSIGISEKPEFKEVTLKDGDGNTTTINKDGMTITPKDLETGKTAVSLTKDGLNNGGNKITNVAAGDVSANSTDAVNGGQLHAVKQDVKAAKTEVKAGDSGNVTVNKSEDTTDKHPVYTVDMKKDITLDKLTVKDEEHNKTEVTPGKVSVDGKNGSGVTLNGADGSIGLKGENGKDALSIKGEKGQAGVDGKNGTDGKTRIVYEYADPKNPGTKVREEVATLNDGIKYKGDSGEAYTKLNKETKIVGGQTDSNKLSDNNIGVVASQEGDNAKLTVKLAKELKDLTSVETKDEEGNKTVQNSKGTTITDKDGNKTEITKDGMTITPKDLETGKTAVSLTKDGLNNGGNKITHVADGTADTDAVNKSQLDKAKAAATTKVEGSENIQVDRTPEKDGSMTYTVKTKDKMTLGKDSDKKIVADGETGKLTVGKEVEMDGTTGNARFGTVKVNGEKGTVGGLTNTTWDKDNIVSGQAATEDQLKVLDKKMQNNTEELINKGMDFSGNDYDAKNAKTKIHKKLGDRLEIIGGLEAGAEADSKNLRTRVTDDGKLELLMAKNPKFKSVEAGEGDTKVTIGNTGIQIGDKTYITKDGINANGNKITNVAEGTADTDAVNKSQLDKAKAAATTKVEGSENIQVDRTPEKDGSMTYTVKTKDKMTLGKDSDKKIVADGETGKLTVGKEVEMDGTTGNARFGTVKVNGEKGTVGGLTNTTWDKDNIVSGQAATEDQLKAVDDKVDNLGNKIDKTTEKVEKGLNFAADTGTTNKKLGDTLTIAGDDKNITTSVEEGKVKVALKEDVKVKTLTSETVTTDKLILKGKDGKTTDVGETLDKHDKDIQENKKAIEKGLNFAANHGEVKKQLGDTMSIKGKDGLSEKEIEEKYDVENIVTSVDKEGNLWIKMAKNPKFKSVEAGEGDTKVTIGDIGIKIGDKTYITKDGINANNNKIKNVADGKVAKGSKDAINGGQLHDALSNVQEGMNQINHRVDKLDDRMHRGLANAAAMSTVEFLEIGINQATVGAAIGTYRGNQAVAVGVQAAPTENMRVHAKVSVAPSRNNTETIAGVGASWRFNIK